MYIDFGKKIFVLLLVVPILFGCGSDESDEDTSNINFDGPNSLRACILDTPIEEEMTLLVNQARAVARTCGGFGAFSATTTVTWNEQLREAADRHSRDMAYYNFFSHTGSDGSDPGIRINATGYSFQNARENISAGRPDAAGTVQDGWLNSPVHCEAIMNANLFEIGAACVVNEAADYKTYWTLVLAAPN
ncbi:MAG: CAP domain-containing protein [Deltaproteobacteria bacterium]|nr:CAP domain-containing protein [Deltaproteobacteria bacterium]